MRRVIPFILCVAFIYQQTSLAQVGVAPISYPTAGAAYIQNFDGLPNSGSFTLNSKGPINLTGSPLNGAGLGGWQIFMTGGSNSSAGFGVSTGSSTGNGIYSLGASGATDRALGSLSSSTGVYAFGVVFTNTTGNLLNKFSVSFTAEQWRKGGSTNKNTWTFKYKTGPLTHIDQTGLLVEANLNFSSVINTATGASLDGNISVNQQNISFTVNGINWKSGEQLLLRWDDADEAGNDDAVGIDNFTFSAGLLSTAPLVQSLAADSLTANTAQLHGSVNDNYAATSVWFEYDSVTLFSHPVSISAVPSNVSAGTGITNVAATLTGLEPGSKYYFRIKATNVNGSSTGSALPFTTTINLPTVTTAGAASVSTSTANLGGNITNTGGSAITERGIVWALNSNPTVSNNKIIMGTGAGIFMQPVSGLPPGTVLNVRAYASNAGGTAYGSNIVCTTQTSIVSLTALLPGRTHAATVDFKLQTAQNISGLSASNFAVTAGIAGASVTAINGSGNTYTITVNTGTGDGTIRLNLANDTGISPSVSNKPFQSLDLYTIDKTAPIINLINVPDKPMKIDDTVLAIIRVNPDPDTYTLEAGNINGFAISGFTKKNDSTYAAVFTIASGGNDIAALANIPVRALLSDSIGNNSVLFQSPIIQSSDPIDANRPLVTHFIIPPNGIYKTGDTLDFIFRFTENIFITTTGGMVSLSVTVGTKQKTAVYSGGDGSDSLLFRYIIQPGDADKDGIKTGSSITLNNTQIKDLVGNFAFLSFTNTSSTKNIIVDAVAPTVSNVVVPAAAVYKTGNILDFVVNFSKRVIVNTVIGLPFITISIGTKLKNAPYVSGTGSNSLLFRYTIEPDDSDKDGIKLISPIGLNMATIKDEPGNHATLSLNNIGALSKISINPVTAAVNNILVPRSGIYKAGDTLELVVNFSEKIWVGLAGGIPSLKLTIGSSYRHALYQNGSGTNTLVFLYPIQPGDEDSNGIKMNTIISLNNGVLKDVFGNDVPVLLNNIPTTEGILIDAVTPAIKTVIVPVKNIYKSGDTLDFTVIFSEKIKMNIFIDTPSLKLIIGNAIKKVSYVNGSGTTYLLFRYVIREGDLDKNGIKLDSVLSAENSTITDLAGNTAQLTLKNIGALSNVKIDAMAPSFVMGSQATLAACENTGAVSIAELLAVKDEEAGEQLTWQIIATPLHGSISKNIFTATSKSNSIIPNGMQYISDTHFTGTDTFLVQVSDGVNTAQKTFAIQIQPFVTNNKIVPPQMICSNSIPEPISGSLPSGGNGQYQFIWELSSTADTNSFSKAAGTNDLQHYAPAQLTATTWFRRKIVSGACADISATLQITVVKNGIWTGIINSDWNNTNNWCNNTIPNNTTDVFITANTRYTPVIKDTARCNHLMLLDNAQLTINGILQINGNINAAPGTIDAERGTIIFTGFVAQNIPAQTLQHHLLSKLIINNTAGVTLQDDIIITGTLLVKNGSLVTNNHLTLKHTGSIGSSAAGTRIIGNIALQHYIKGGRRAFRLLGNPFRTDLSLDMIKDSIDISGDGGSLNGFTNTGSNQPSAFRYDTLIYTDSLGFDAGWIPFTSTNGQLDNAWKESSAMRLLVRGRPGQGLDTTPAGDGKNGTYLPGPVQFTVSGQIYTGDKEVTLLKSKYPGYSIIANPYPANINLSLLTRGSDVAINYWVWDPYQGKKGGYSSIPFKSSYILPPFGTFIVKVNGSANNTLLFTENCKVNDSVPDSLPVIYDNDAYHIEMRLESDSIFWDRILLFEIDSARNNFDKTDAEKFWNSEVNFYSISRDQKLLSVDARPVNNEFTIPLGIQTNQTGTFNIKIAKAVLPASNSLMLHDRYLNKWMNLQEDSIYTFTITNDTNSKGNARFEITSPKKQVERIINLSKLVIKITPVPANDKIRVNYLAPEWGNTTIRITNLAGTTMKSLALGLQKEGQVTISVTDLISGIYLLEVSCGTQRVTQKIIKN